MCTVTIIPKGENDFVLTSNRDEAPKRIPLAPDFYTINETKVLFPKDVLSGGTWIGLSEKNRLVCVLNGGYVIHKRKPEYRMSRGVVANDIMTSNVLEPTVENYDLQDIEPFTMVIDDWNTNLKFYELVWDGVTKHFTELPLAPKIWSSSTLYSSDMQKERLQWFNTFKSDNKMDASSLLEVHKTAGGKNDEYGVVMDRGFVKTTSITQVEKSGGVTNMKYESLLNNMVTSKELETSQLLQ